MTVFNKLHHYLDQLEANGKKEIADHIRLSLKLENGLVHIKSKLKEISEDKELLKNAHLANSTRSVSDSISRFLRTGE